MRRGPGYARSREPPSPVRRSRARGRLDRGLRSGAPVMDATATAHGQSAVVLLSGGLDSTTLLAYAVNAGFTTHAMTFRYGQRHAVEVDAARRIARQFGAREHIIVDIDLRTFGGSALTSDEAVPKDRSHDEMRLGIPITYVPARN